MGSFIHLAGTLLIVQINGGDLTNVNSQVAFYTTL